MSLLQVKKIEIIYSHEGEHKVHVLEDLPFTIGKSSNCNIVYPDAKLDIGVIIQKNDKNKVVVSSMDDSIPFIVNEKVMNHAVFTSDTFFKIGEQEFWFSFEVDHSAAGEDSHGEVTRTGIIMLGDPPPPVPEVTAKHNLAEINKQAEEKSQIIPIKSQQVEQTTSGPVPKSVEGFSIVFDESDYRAGGDPLYKAPGYSYDNYIELSEDPDREEDTDSIFLEHEGKAIHVVYMNNGIVLNEDYFSYKVKRVYISNCDEGKNTFKVHECLSEKSDMAYINDGKVMVNRQDGFELHRSVISGKFEKVHDDLTELQDGERLIFTKGTTQIIIKKTTMAPALLPDKLFNVDRMIVKYVGSAWMMVFPLLFLLLLVDNKKEEEPKKEIVIVYKKKVPKKKVAPPKPEPIEEKVVAKKMDEVKKEVKQEIKKTEPVKEKKPVVVETKKPPKKTPPKKTTVAKTPKKAVKQPTTVKSTSPKVAKVKKARKSVKSYNFNAASKFSAMLGNTMSSAATTPGKKSKVSAAIGTVSDEASSSNVDLDSKLAAVSKLSTRGINSGEGDAGVRGLSSKTGTSFASVESSTRILGAVDPDLVRKLLREKIPHFRSCYLKELHKDSSLSGVFDLNFKIDKYGRGVDVDVEGKKSKFSRVGINCMRKVVRMISFPKPKGGGLVEVSQPLNFYTNK